MAVEREYFSMSHVDLTDCVDVVLRCIVQNGAAGLEALENENRLAESKILSPNRTSHHTT